MASFDRINHQYLLRKIKTFPTLNKTIKAWLRAGVIDGREFQSTNEGTPQGGAISPLLANIALHGIEEFITAKFPYKSICKRTNGIKRGYNFRSPVTIRYADDLVVIHESKEVVERCKELLEEWLEPIGLKLKESKTRIVHTSKGFDFLGYNFRIYSAGKTKSDKDSYGRMLGHITIIKPSNNALKEHIQSLRETIRYYKTGKQEALINALNKIIRGWTNYHKINSASKTFSKLNHLLFLMLKSWASRRSKGGKKKMMRKYWDVQSWTFRGSGITLMRHSDVKILRHTKIQGNKSPYDGDFVYWGTRMAHHPDLSTREATLLKRQKGKCPICGLHFLHGDVLEVDHIIPKSMKGRDTYDNLQLLHRHCHHIKTRSDGSLEIAKKNRKTHIKTSTQ